MMPCLNDGCLESNFFLRGKAMIAVRVFIKVTQEPLKRTPVVIRMDADDVETGPILTDRTGVAQFDLPPGSGKVLVSGVER
jgi:tRNA 2-thiouridine synthesizing protein E